jgi:tetratricopeptide (TPR) repeat protein
MPKPVIPVSNHSQARQLHKLQLWGKQQIDQAIVLHQQGRTTEAEEIYRQVLERMPHNPDALHLLGLALYHRGQAAQGLVLIDQAIDIAPKEALFYNSRSACYVELQEWVLALADCDRALELNPKMTDAINNMAMILPNLNRWQDAIEYSTRYRDLNPEMPSAWFNLAVSMQEWGQHEASLAVYQKCLELDPRHIQAVINMANAHKELSNWSQAQALLTQAEAIDPTFGEIYNVRAAVLREIGKPNAAIQMYSKAQELNPKKAKIYEYNKGLAQLQAGIMPHGWINYEHRWNVVPMPSAFKKHTPWLGQPLDNQILIVSREQGQGDSIQFCRFIPMIKQRWPTCTIKMNTDVGLEGLMSTVEGVDEILPSGEEIIELTWHHWVPMMSLPWIFSTTIDTIPCKIPYIHTPQESKDKWALKVNKDKIRVGLVWSGGHRELEPKVWSVNARRNCSLSQFESMVLKVHEARPDIEFYTLQKGNPAEQELRDRIAQVDLPIIDLMSECKDWVDTAGLVEQMDLVITVDTSVVHLAGALGRPVWMLNRLDSCWRWMLRRTDSPWYPSLRIFRQTRPRDWQPVVDEITQNLIDFKP